MLPPIVDKAQMVQQIHHEYPLPNKVIWWLTAHLGAWTILACIATGAFIILTIVFRNKLKELIGPWLRWADRTINKGD